MLLTSTQSPAERLHLVVDCVVLGLVLSAPPYWFAWAALAVAFEMWRTRPSVMNKRAQTPKGDLDAT